jgi:hypothetical protein
LLCYSRLLRTNTLKRGLVSAALRTSHVPLPPSQSNGTTVLLAAC